MNEEDVELVSEFMHDAWMKWAGTVLREETISEDRRARWKSFMVPYAELPDIVKEKDREFARSLLKKMGR